MRVIFTGLIVMLAVSSPGWSIQDPVPMKPAEIPEAVTLEPEPVLIPEIMQARIDAANRCVADFSLPYYCCADDATLGVTADEDRLSLRLAREEFCPVDDRAYPLIVQPSGGELTGDGIQPTEPVEPAETESDPFGSSARPD